MYYYFAIQKEFKAGNLISAETGSYGDFWIRFTNEGLTEREKNYVALSKAFRLRARHNCLLLDGGDFLPYKDNLFFEFRKKDFLDKNSWLEVPN